MYTGIETMVLTTSLIHIVKSPLYQLLLFVVLTIITVLVIKPRQADQVWVVSGIIYGCFILMNSLMVLFVTSQWSYFFISLGYSVLFLVLMAITVPLLIKWFSAEGSGESAMILLIIIYHPVALMLFMLSKWIYNSLF